MQVLLNSTQLALTLKRLAHQLIENVTEPNNIAFVALQPRGVAFGQAVVSQIQQQIGFTKVPFGVMDITFYRDDIHQQIHLPNATDIAFSIEGKTVVLLDDVLYTGRTIRAALDALQDFGRPRNVQLCVLIDRKFNRELPIQPDFIGKEIDTIVSQKVKVNWTAQQVELY
jgi:pyrimidine operon attenuation protein / uracil phosphoribosyltransferase